AVVEHLYKVAQQIMERMQGGMQAYNFVPNAVRTKSILIRRIRDDGLELFNIRMMENGLEKDPEKLTLYRRLKDSVFDECERL
ncbi:hypothetical protein, partial [Vibrio vulnificus]